MKNLRLVIVVLALLALACPEPEGAIKKKEFEPLEVSPFHYLAFQRIRDFTEDYYGYLFRLLYNHYKLGQLDSTQVASNTVPTDSIYTWDGLLDEIEKYGYEWGEIKDFEMDDLIVMLYKDVPFIARVNLEVTLGKRNRKVQTGYDLLFVGYGSYDMELKNKCSLAYFGYNKERLMLPTFFDMADKIIFPYAKYEDLENLDMEIQRFHKTHKTRSGYELVRLKRRKRK